MKLSAIVITHNEESTIKRCLASVAFADEIIVVDSGSTDKTLSIARSAGARVFEHPWGGFGAQKNYGAQQATAEWVLFIDADEEVTSELKQSIITAVANPAAPDFYWLKITTVFLGKELRHLYGHNPRLFRRARGQWTEDFVHEQVETVDGSRIRLGDSLSKLLSSPLMHYSHDTVKSYLSSMERYTDLDAAQMKKTGAHRSGRAIKPSWTLPWKLAGRQLVKLLFYRRGFLDGPSGLAWSFLSGYYEFRMAQKYRALCA